MRESDIERRLVKGVKDLGGVAYKFISPGNMGVPDRLIVLPNGMIKFVELKTAHGKTSRMQDYQILRLGRLGADVTVAYGLTGVEEVLRQCEVLLAEWPRGAE